MRRCAAGAAVVASLLLLGACQNVKTPAPPKVATKQVTKASVASVTAPVLTAEPAQLPDTVPTWIYSDTNLVDGTNVIAGKVAKNILIVAFDSGVTSAARQAVLSRVHATTVGGVRMQPELGGGFYYVRVDAPTPAAVLALRESVASVPGVALAIPAMNDAVGPDSHRASRPHTSAHPPASAP